MAERKAQTTTIDKDIWKDFKIACVQDDVNMNDVLEELMKMYIKRQITIHIPQKEK